MKKKLLTIGLSLTALSAQAATLDDLRGPLGGFYQTLKANFSTSSSFSGVVESLDRDECAEVIDDLIKDSDDEKLHSITYFRSKISSRDLKGKYSESISSRRGSKMRPGLSENSFIQANSYSKKQAPHLQPGCSKFLLINNVQLVEMKNDKNQIKTCRKVNLGMDNLNYDLLYCEGENNLYSNFSPSKEYKVISSIEKLSN